MHRLPLLGRVIGASVVAIAMTVAAVGLRAQSEPLRVYDLGRLCLYAVDTGGIWATTKNAIGLPDSDPCPREGR